MPENSNIITIDGPSGAGKGTIARIVAREMNFSYLDTGAMYRAMAVAVLKSDVDIENDKELDQLLSNTSIEISNSDQQQIYLNGKNITAELRIQQISTLSSLVAKNRKIREFLVTQQRKIAAGVSIVVEGRDMGTYVFPDAKHKFYLDADIDVRAKRRQEQLMEQGFYEEFEDVKHDLVLRDKQDMGREESPLHPSPNAVIIDTTELTISEVVDLIVKEVNKR